MAVYTKVSEDQLKAFLNDYDLGELKSFEGIEQGVENSNYHLFTTKGRYILTLFEKRVSPEDLPFFFAYTKYLSDNGVRCPSAVPDKNKHIIGALAGKLAAIITFLEGKDITAAEITAKHCQQLGRELACMHLAVDGFDKKRVNNLSVSGWKKIAEKVGKKANEVEKGLADFIAAEIAHLGDFWPKGYPKSLPSGAVHADAFPDNVFFKEGELFGIIDFYFSCTDFFAYDLAITINAWCFNEKNILDKPLLDAFLKGYEAVRPLNETERAHLSLFCRGAALRFLLSRLHDWVFHNPDDFVQPKDPKEYIQKLKFHQSIGLLDYQG